MCTDPKLCLLITHKIQVFQGPFLHKRWQKIWGAFQNWGKQWQVAKLVFEVLCKRWATMATDIASETPFTNYQTTVLYRCQNFFLLIGSTFYKTSLFYTQHWRIPSSLFNIQVTQNYSGQKKSVWIDKCLSLAQYLTVCHLNCIIYKFYLELRQSYQIPHTKLSRALMKQNIETLTQNYTKLKKLLQ